MPLLPRLILGMPLILIVPVVGMSQITSTQILGWLNPTTTLLGSVHWDIKWVTGHPSHCRSNHIIQGSPIVTPHLPCHFTLFLSPFTFFKCLLLSKKILYQMILVGTTSGKMKTYLHPSSLEMSPLAPMVSSKVLAPCLWQCLLLVFLILLVFCRTPLPISHLTSFCSTACSQDMWVWSTSLSTSPPSSVSYEFIMYPLLTDTLTASPVAPVASPSGSSLHPCDLASQLSSPGGKMPPPLPPDQPSNCPDHYPQAILWWFDDHKTDPNIHTSPGNKPFSTWMVHSSQLMSGRPSMNWQLLLHPHACTASASDIFPLLLLSSHERWLFTITNIISSRSGIGQSGSGKLLHLFYPIVVGSGRGKRHLHASCRICLLPLNLLLIPFCVFWVIPVLHLLYHIHILTPWPLVLPLPPLSTLPLLTPPTLPLLPTQHRCCHVVLLWHWQFDHIHGQWCQ